MIFYNVNRHIKHIIHVKMLDIPRVEWVNYVPKILSLYYVLNAQVILRLIPIT